MWTFPKAVNFDAARLATMPPQQAGPLVDQVEGLHDELDELQQKFSDAVNATYDPTAVTWRELESLRDSGRAAVLAGLQQMLPVLPKAAELADDVAATWRSEQDRLHADLRGIEVEAFDALLRIYPSKDAAQLRGLVGQTEGMTRQRERINAARQLANDASREAAEKRRTLAAVKDELTKVCRHLVS
jgi:hypothetical protein